MTSLTTLLNIYTMDTLQPGGGVDTPHAVCLLAWVPGWLMDHATISDFTAVPCFTSHNHPHGLITTSLTPLLNIYTMDTPQQGGGVDIPHAVRLLTWVPGCLMNHATITESLMVDTGRFLGRMCASLRGFDHPGVHRTHMWDLANTLQVEAFVPLIGEPEVCILHM